MHSFVVVLAVVVILAALFCSPPPSGGNDGMAGPRWTPGDISVLRCPPGETRIITATAPLPAAPRAAGEGYYTGNPMGKAGALAFPRENLAGPPRKERYGEPPGTLRAVHRDELGFRGWADMPGDYEGSSASALSAYVERSA